MPTFELTNWKSDVVRLTLFSSTPWIEAPEAIFRLIQSTDAEATSSKPAAGEASAAGPWEEHRFEVKRTLNRIDFLVNPTMTVPEVTLIAVPSNVTLELARKVIAWLPTQSQSINRMAVGCGALWEVGSIEDGNRKVAEMTDVFSRDMSGYRDLQIQLNNRKNSAVKPGLTLNRIARSSTLAIESGVFSPGTIQRMTTKHFTAFVTDVNTDGESIEVLPPDLLPSLLLELIEESNSLLASGVS